jgi:hypothetical protein
VGDVTALGKAFWVATRLLKKESGGDTMKSPVKILLAMALVVAAATGAAAQAVGNWQHVHGQVQSVQGNQLTLKVDDGRVVNVDMSQVSQPVQGAMTPNLGVTVTGFPGTSPDRFTARYIEQDQIGSTSGTAAATSNPVISRILPLVPQFVGSAEFQNRAASFRNNRTAARTFVSQLYRGFLDREPNEQERNYWMNHLLQNGDIKGTVESFLKSPEYTAKNKNESQVITDLYKAVAGRTPSADEIRTWQQQIAQR